MLWIIAGVVLVAALAFVFYGRAGYYRRIFSDEHFQEVYSTFVDLLRAQRPSGLPADSPAAPSTALTSAGLVLGVTYRAAGDDPVLHISLSQQEPPTTRALANRFAFFLLCVLDRNKLGLNPFFTDSGVHHLVFTGQLTELTLNDFSVAFEAYRSSFQPLPFVLHTLEPAEGERHGAAGQ